MKKILILNKFYPPKFGGIETTVGLHASKLSQNKNSNVTVLVCHENKLSKNEILLIENLKIIKLKQFGIFFSMPLSLTYFFSALSYIKNSDCVFLHEPWPIGGLSLLFFNLFFFKKKNKLKTIIFWHSDIKKNKFIDELFFFFQKINLIRSNYILVNSKQVIKNSKIINLDSLEKKVFEIPTPVVFSNKKVKIRKEVLKIISSYHENNFFVFYGRLVAYKGIDAILNSLPFISQSNNILIAGEGIKSELIKTKIKKYKNLKFYNKFLTEAEKKYVLKNATAFLFPSISEAETLGLTQIEAMSQGCPVINTYLSTAVPYVSLNNLTGKTIVPNDHELLAHTINKFPKKHSKKWRYFSKQSIIRYNNLFSYKTFNNQFNKFLKKTNYF